MAEYVVEARQAGWARYRVVRVSTLPGRTWRTVLGTYRTRKAADRHVARLTWTKVDAPRAEQ